jgi:hypothetical protein
MPQRKNRHHILWAERIWDLEPYIKLRGQRPLIARISVEQHRLLHLNCAPVPPLGYPETQRIFQLFEPDPNPILAINNLVLAIEQASDYFVHDVDRLVAFAQREALLSQIPYIAKGREQVPLL